MAEPPDRDRLDLGRSQACVDVEDELADAARIEREGGELAKHYPALARHLEDCEWCRAELAELVEEPDIQAEADIEAEPSDSVERYLAAALAEPERIVRLRAATKLGAARRIGPGALAALADVAAADPDADVREAALDALGRIFDVAPRDRHRF